MFCFDHTPHYRPLTKKLTKENVELKYEVALRDKEIRYLRRKLFGRSKESRKNWLFSSSLRGAQASGVILSLVKTAEHNGLSATAYIQYLLEELPTLYDNGTLREKIQAYLPWSEEVQAKVAKIVYENND